MHPLYIINLPYKTDRRERLTAHLLETGLVTSASEIRWVRAISGDWCLPPAWWTSGNGAWGCLMSHLRVVQDAMMEGLENYMVLEDDAVFQPQAVEMLARRHLFRILHFQILFFFLLHPRSIRQKFLPPGGTVPHR